MEPLPGSEPAAPGRVLPCDPWGVPTRRVAGEPHQARGTDAIRGGHVSADLLDAACRWPRRDDPCASAAAHQGSRRGGRSPMRGTVLWAAVAVLGAACPPMERRSPPQSDTTLTDTTPSAPVAQPTALTPPAPPPGPGATKVGTVEGFLTPESVLHDPVQDIYFVSRSEEHTSELQSPDHLVCRLLLE